MLKKWIDKIKDKKKNKKKGALQVEEKEDDEFSERLQAMPFRQESQSMYTRSPNKLQKSEVDFQFSNKKEPLLPLDFAQKLINLEIQVERPDFTKEHVNSLMDLYTVCLS